MHGSDKSLPKSLIPFLLSHVLIPSIMNALNMRMRHRIHMHLSVGGKMTDSRVVDSGSVKSHKILALYLCIR